MSKHPPYPDSPDKPAATLLTAINTFNTGAYFASHEFLEALWMDETDPHRDLYKGILQIGIGLLHLQRGNIKGARCLLQSGCQLLEPFTPSCFGLDLNQLLNDARTISLRLDNLELTHSFIPEDAIQIQTV